VLAGDLLGPPYGLLQLSAQAIRAGHSVTTLNLADFAWPEVERVVAGLEAEVFGMTCLTANRRGVAFVADAIRRFHPRAHIAVGGPHASALPGEILDRHRTIDTVVVGEGEAALLEICHRVDAGEPTEGIPGTAWRSGDEVRQGPPVETTTDLDSLASLHSLYPSSFVITSRGCPGRCTFCGSRGMWGSRLRLCSVGSVLDTLETVVRGHGLPLVAIKDDTFTASRRRTLEICEGIRERDLRFVWICDTRADSLDGELLRAMRLAGCQQISIGVESGSTEILERLNKRITPERVRNVTRLARDLGFIVRWYVILGSPGETFDTLEQTFALIRSERPHQVVFSPFSTYPGTAEYERQVALGDLGPGVYFDQDFLTPTFYRDVAPEVSAWIREWLRRNPGIVSLARPTVDTCRGALERLPGSPLAHMDLGGALLDAGDLDGAASQVRRALDLGHPLAGIGHTYLACIAAARGDIAATEHHLDLARRGYPFRHTMTNWERFTAWRDEGSMHDIAGLDIIAHPAFEIAEEKRQPMNPGPIDG
jgi:radical SAM superfamily enzyme YgiQ (UPF0313 family)